MSHYCPNCGAQRHEGDQYCPSCGADVSQFERHGTDGGADVSTRSEELERRATARRAAKKKRARNRRLAAGSVVLVVALALGLGLGLGLQRSEPDSPPQRTPGTTEDSIGTAPSVVTTSSTVDATSTSAPVESTVASATDQTVSEPTAAEGIQTHPVVVWQDGALLVFREPGRAITVFDVVEKTAAAWSADGKEILFVDNRESDLETLREDWVLHALDVSTGDVRYVATAESIRSGSGTFFAAFTGLVNPGTGRIYMSVDNGTVWSSQLVSIDPASMNPFTGPTNNLSSSGEGAGLMVSTDGTWLSFYDYIQGEPGLGYDTLGVALASAANGAERYIDPAQPGQADTTFDAVGWWDDQTLVGNMGGQKTSFVAPNWERTSAPPGLPENAEELVRLSDGSFLVFATAEDGEATDAQGHTRSLWIAFGDGGGPVKVTDLGPDATWGWCTRGLGTKNAWLEALDTPALVDSPSADDKWAFLESSSRLVQWIGGLFYAMPDMNPLSNFYRDRAHIAPHVRLWDQRYGTQSPLQEEYPEFYEATQSLADEWKLFLSSYAQYAKTKDGSDLDSAAEHLSACSLACDRAWGEGKKLAPELYVVDW